MSLGDGVTWAESLPDNNTLAHQIDDYDRDLRVGVRARMAREHVWPETQTATRDGGHHAFVTFQQQTAAPTLLTTLSQVGALYVGSSASGYPLLFENSGGTLTTIVGSTVGLVPSGTICLWSGSIATIPTGWYLCNGSNGTPDLRNRFVIGAGTGGTYAVGETGGASSVNLAHTHTGTTDAIATASIRCDDNSGGTDHDFNDPNNHTHTFTSGSAGSATQSILNPYYALCYIMKA